MINSVRDNIMWYTYVLQRKQDNRWYIQVARQIYGSVLNSTIIMKFRLPRVVALLT